MTCSGVLPRLETKLGFRMIFLGQQVWHLHFRFCLHLAKRAKERGTPTCRVAGDLHAGTRLISPALGAQEQWEGKLTWY